MCSFGSGECRSELYPTALRIISYDSHSASTIPMAMYLCEEQAVKNTTDIVLHIVSKHDRRAFSVLDDVECYLLHNRKIRPMCFTTGQQQYVQTNVQDVLHFYVMFDIITNKSFASQQDNTRANTAQ
ncbi:hypothetical protein ElyMa_005823100 [Elysia marginata]|uniref:Uncharacterized protein n=1 Tax=Elysia marginata TaxID=1093978 RepID=A0AAV4FVH5_9GAST|nr:hypothetical protein ElyMa_005823100 [Elysia marginata]